MINKFRKKNYSSIFHGIVHIQTTFNNTIVTITDENGNTLAWSSSGKVGFKGARRSTSFAAQAAAEQATKKVLELSSIKSVSVIIKGLGEGRESSIRGLIIGGLHITSIEDRTPIAHNGCRARKKRRI